MTPRDFIYWLNGYLELSDQKALTETQVQIIKDHLALVMTKVTPDVLDPSRPFIPWPPQPWDTGTIPQPPPDTTFYCTSKKLC